MVIVILALAACCITGMRWSDPPAAIQFWSKPIIVEFVFGIVVAEVVARCAPNTRLAFCAVAAGIVVAAACAALLPSPFGSNGWLRVLAAGVPAAFLVCAVMLAGEPKYLRPAMAFFGDLS
jgi:exopolysaccharide production protein ExoZ